MLRVLLLACLLASGLACADDLFPFAMPGLEPTRGITDLSWLNDAPAGKDGFVRVQDGHFVDGKGRRLRFLATNFTFASPFPDHDTADKLAARLASLGINCVRFHHMDNHAAPRGIWKAGTPKLDTFDPEQLDRLDYFIAQLKQHGIYADINLHVSRNYWEGAVFADGLASDRERAEKLPKYGKGLDKINDQMIRMQRDYARALLTHVNPYTKTAYAAEPCVALVEINNENTLLSLKVGALPDFYRQEVLQKWNRWLKTRYPSAALLLAAWGGHEEVGANLLPAACATQGGDGLQVVTNTPGAYGVTVKKLPGVAWQAQLHWTNLTLVDGRLYTVAFAARSDVPRSLPLSVRLQQPDWRNCGLSETAALSPAWNTYSYSFRASQVEPGVVRLDFTLGSGPLGTFELKDLTLRTGGTLGLKPGESLEAGNVGAGEGRADTARGQDWTRFLAETERAYAAGMRMFLKNELAVHAGIFDTQASYGGIAGAYRESFSDVVDMHSYWQHPRFPGRPWDLSNWNIRNTPMVDEPQEAANLGRLAVYRVAGKPFTVTEYDHPAPSQYLAEMFPLIASFAAVQDWDGVFQFDWGGTNAAAGKIDGYFALQQNPGKLAFLPAAALMFRRGDVSPAAGTATLAIPATQVAALAASGVSMNDAWRKAGVALAECLGRRFSVSFGGGATSTASRAGSDGAQIRWNTNSFVYTVDAPAAKVVIGRCTGRTIQLAGAAFAVQTNAHGFAVLALNAVDGQPIARARRMLLTAAGEVENTGMGWNAAHTSVGNQWGQPPTRCAGIAATITLDTTCASARVFALDGAGNRAGTVPAARANGRLSFEIGPQFKTLWYEIAAE